MRQCPPSLTVEPDQSWKERTWSEVLEGRCLKIHNLNICQIYEHGNEKYKKSKIDLKKLSSKFQKLKGFHDEKISKIDNLNMTIQMQKRQIESWE